MKELQDTQGSEYFKFLSRKAHEGASNQAKVDVANARMIGETGEAEKRGETRQKISKIDAQTAVLETQRKSEKAFADAELTNTQTKLNMGINLANIEASRQAEAKDAELQRDVEIKRAEMELERRRATEVVHAKIERESAQQKADAKLYAETKGADGLLYKQRQDAEAKFYTDTKGADGLLYKQKQEAEAAFFAKKKEAEGISAMAEAYGHMADVLGGPSGYANLPPILCQASTNIYRLMQYLMLQNNTYEKLAKANATAINGLQPKITVWNTGEGASSDSTAPIRNLLQSLPPLLSTINDQTGIAPPSWLAQMPATNQTPASSQALTSSAKPKTNGVYVNGDAHGSK